MQRKAEKSRLHGFYDFQHFLAFASMQEKVKCIACQKWVLEAHADRCMRLNCRPSCINAVCKDCETFGAVWLANCKRCGTRMYDACLEDCEWCEASTCHSCMIRERCDICDDVCGLCKRCDGRGCGRCDGCDSRACDSCSLFCFHQDCRSNYCKRHLCTHMSESFWKRYEWALANEFVDR